MIISVVADLVPFRDDSPNEIRIFLRVDADEEKAAFTPRAFRMSRTWGSISDRARRRK
jgi:hypothetical protein